MVHRRTDFRSTVVTTKVCYHTPAVYGPYDAIVIAAPLLGSNIEFHLSPDEAAASEAVLNQPYQVTVTTYVVAGPLRPDYFKVTRMPPVARVFVTSSAEVPFSSLAMRSRGGGGSPGADGPEQRVYKVRVCAVSR